jgi:hypothetical protein
MEDRKMFVIQTQWGYVKQAGGCWNYVPNPDNASMYSTRREAMDNRPGHHRDMGGSGFHGEVMTHMQARQIYEAVQRNKYWRGT